MKVQAITKYTFKSKEYNSLGEIKEEIHNTIGLEVLDKIAKTCPLEKHKDYFKLLDLLCSKEVREVLTECFNVKFDEPITDYDDNCFNENTKEINVLDVKTLKK